MVNEQKMQLSPELEHLLLIFEPRGVESYQDAGAQVDS